MYKRRFSSKGFAISMILCILVSLLPTGFSREARAAGEDIEVYAGRALIGNLSHEADNAMINFQRPSGDEGHTAISNVPGFKLREWKYLRPDSDFSRGDVLIGMDRQPGEELNGYVEFEIDVAANPQLKELALSPTAKVKFGYKALFYWEGFTWERYSSIEIKIDGQRVLYGIADDGDLGADSGSASFTANSKIEIIVRGGRRIFEDGEGGTGAAGVFVKFEDKTRPVLNEYTFTGNGAERNNLVNQKELYVKQNEHITLAYNFSEHVKPYALNSGYHEHFTKHPLFMNPDGTGLPAAGQQQYLKNLTYNSTNLSSFNKSVVFQYIGQKYHHTGNLPLKPKLTGTTSGAPVDKSMEEKLKEATFVDGAGNIATILLPGKASTSSNNHLVGKTVNPFDYQNRGYSVIVDAVAPKYTKVGNGIQPEILTGVTLNKDDTIEFTLQLTEEAIVKTGWNINETFLLFNNGMKAYYVSGSSTQTWKFHMKIPDGITVEAPLLKVVALSHDNKVGAPDTNVIQDYAGNMLIQPANYEGIHVDGDESNVNSRIDWATLSIDNTKPIIGFRFENGGANNITYQKNGKATIDANDPVLKVPHLDPIGSGTDRPSKGIYRPSNMTGPSSPSVGLVYYAWSKSAADPFAAKGNDHYAAIKRYSLSAKQPRVELYPEPVFAELNLQVVNNKTNMLAPPSEALTDENSGEWYLHTWTADMTWDSARELMQYEKMQSYIQNNQTQYDQWMAEATGSAADKKFYADNKALGAVGQYGDVSIWPLSDYKQDDSNWTYQVGVMKLDNRAPTVTMGDIRNNQTADVQISAKVVDEHSGIESVQYKWVKEGNDPEEAIWHDATLNGDTLSANTFNDLFEDGSYWFYIKSVDKAGNERIAQKAELLVVNSESRVQARFEPEANPNYVKSHDILFHISGLNPQPLTLNTVTSVTYATYTPTTVTLATYDAAYVKFAFSTSTVRPSEDSDFTELTAYAENEQSGELSYLIPADSTKNGMHYVHIKAKEAGAERYYYYSKAYYFDQLPPTITYSKNGVAYPMPSHEVIVTVTETYSTDGVTKEYVWVKADDAAPLESSSAWKALPANGKVVIDDTALQAGEVIDYKLYVKAKDGAGNTTIGSTTDSFKVSKAGAIDTPPAPAKSDLIYLYGDTEDGYTAIVKLGLDTADKEGYEFSISPDRGVSWMKWRPYTNFAAVKVPTNKASDLQIQVKYKTPGGLISEPKALDIAALSKEEPVYALATLGTSKPVSPDQGVEIDVVPPLGIKVVPSAVNPSALVRAGNKFVVKQNGTYTFDLTDATNPERKDTLFVVVKNVDATKPLGSITYLNTESTNGNISVQLSDLTESVRITNNNGRSIYTFTENGTFTFEFMDEAGNTGTATAVVNQIDKEGPKVKIVHSYQYGENSSKTFATIKDDNGQVLYSSGVTLEVQAVDEASRNFRVLGGEPVVTMQRNGVISFLVTDSVGNTSYIEEEITQVISEPPAIEAVTYTFVDDAGNPVPLDQIVTIDGQPYARGKVQVTLSGRTVLANKVFSGVVPIGENGTYTNQISGADGTFTYSRIYSSEGSATLAVSDLLGNVNKVPVKVKGIDNKAPEIQLLSAVVSIVQNKPDFDFHKDLGGYIVSDNVSSAENITVSIRDLDLSKLGRQQVTYTVIDQVGNISTARQDVVVVSGEGMLIFANDVLISSSSGESALFDRSTLTFHIVRHNVMDVNGQDQVNEVGTFDVIYYSGLYREGQMKTLVEKTTLKQLLDGSFTVTFPQAGWYTLIVRNQEREREYAMFFIGKLD